MSEEPDKESRDHEPSEKKLNDALERGDTPRSRDMSLLGSFLGIHVGLLTLDRGAVGEIGRILFVWFEQLANVRVVNAGDVDALLHAFGVAVGGAVYMAALSLIGVTVVVGAGPQRPRVVWRRIRADWSRLSPANGMRRLFSAEGIREFLKSCGKLLVVILAASASLRLIFVEASVHTHYSPRYAAIMALQDIEGVSRSICAVVLLFALSDVVLSHLAWRKKLRMSRQEVVDERKQSEGDPLLRMRMRSLALDRARRRMLNDVGVATMVIANPTHFAVALKYSRDEDAAPIVVAKGQELLALKIREQAQERQIPVVEQPELARGLYRSVELGQVIPPEFYRAVAEIVNFLAASSSRHAAPNGARQGQGSGP